MKYCFKDVFLRLNYLTSLLKRYSSYFIILTFFIIACKNQQTAASNKNKAPESRLSEADKSTFESAFYEGNKQMILGNHANAITQFKKCVLLDPKSDAALYLLAKEYNITRQFSVSLVYSQSAAKLDPKNIWYISIPKSVLGDQDFCVEWDF